MAHFGGDGAQYGNRPKPNKEKKTGIEDTSFLNMADDMRIAHQCLSDFYICRASRKYAILYSECQKEQYELNGNRSDRPGYPEEQHLLWWKLTQPQKEAYIQNGTLPFRRRGRIAFTARGASDTYRPPDHVRKLFAANYPHCGSRGNDGQKNCQFGGPYKTCGGYGKR